MVPAFGGHLGPTLLRVGHAGELADALARSGVRAVALTWVDNAGVTRVKAIPVEQLEAVDAWGVGMSPVFDVYLSDDSMTASSRTGGPVGDLRLFPDLDRLTPLHSEPRWAWAPVDRRTQQGDPYDGCQRTFARAMTARAASAGLTLKMAFEVEWFVGYDEGDGLTPACRGRRTV
jgi:glutamine synthetase